MEALLLDKQIALQSYLGTCIDIEQDGDVFKYDGKKYRVLTFEETNSEYEEKIDIMIHEELSGIHSDINYFVDIKAFKRHLIDEYEIYHLLSIDRTDRRKVYRDKLYYIFVIG